MRRIRLSTVILTIIFLAALLTYLFVRPPTASGGGQVQHGSRSGSVTPVPSMPLPGMTTRPSPSGSPTGG